MNQTPDEWARLLAGQTIGEYQLGELINAGNFSYVFEAHDKAGRARAAKILKPTINAQAAEEFQREAGLLRKLEKSSNVVTLFDSGEFTIEVDSNGIKLPLVFSYHILELASGCLDELILNRAALSWAERFRLWRGIVLGVHQMHLNQVTHRDLKSSNCLLFVRSRHVTESKVADLGRSRDLSNAAGHSMLQYMQGLGDLTFAPPEFLYLQGRDSESAHLSADLYGLGSVLYELATGQSITGIALGFGPELVRQSLKSGLQNQVVDLSSLRGLYAPAIDVLRSSLPSEIRDQGTSLVRQLCDPLPAARLPRSPTNRKRAGKDKGLEWMLARADILIRSIELQPHRKPVTQRRGA